MNTVGADVYSCNDACRKDHDVTLVQTAKLIFMNVTVVA
jgi:hypothetical protein